MKINGCWYRSSDFGIDEGAVALRTGAQIEDYDPWDSFRRTAWRRRVIDRPYLALFRLAGSGMDDDTKDDQVLAFCRDYGVLGVLPACCSEIRYPAVRYGGTPQINIDYRTGGEWARRTVYVLEEDGGAPGLIWHDALLGTVRLLIAKLRDFLPADCGKLTPGTLRFRQYYREPLYMIRDEACLFVQAVSTLEQWHEEGGGENNEYAARALFWLRELAQTTAPVLRFDLDGGGYEEVRTSPSLLSSFALMYLLDRAAGRRVVRCTHCLSYFVTSDRRGRYCRPSCKHAASSRRFRAKKNACPTSGPIDTPSAL